jgi:hypothetical protein
MGRPRKTGTIADWSIAVRERDSHQCVNCGATDNIVAHHIKTKEQYPGLMFDTENGITLCKKCHGEAHIDIRETDKSPRVDPKNIIAVRNVDMSLWLQFRAQAIYEGLSVGEKLNAVMRESLNAQQP